jgi:hypothetical protein
MKSFLTKYWFMIAIFSATGYAGYYISQIPDEYTGKMFSWYEYKVKELYEK